MIKRQISNLDLKIKLTKEYLDNGGYQKIFFIELLHDLKKVKTDANGNIDPNSVSSIVNSFMMTILADQLYPPFYSPNHISEYQSTLQKSINFDQENIDTIEQFDKIYIEYKDKTDYLFRGQREARWRLYSKLQRHWIIDNLSNKNESYQSFLEKMVSEGRNNYNSKYLETLGEKHDDADNDIAVLGFLQHHGCPTPLLDWTYKFQNALYFGLDGLENNQRKREIDDYFSVYFIDEKSFENGGMRTLIYESVEQLQEFALKSMIKRVAKDDETRIAMEEHFKGRKVIDIKKIKGSGMIDHMLKIKHMINFPATYFGDGKPDDIVFSINNSANIQNQAGVFTWNADPSKPFEMVVSEQSKIANNTTDEKEYILCECFNINKKLANHIRKRLKEDSITRDLIYPTTDLNTLDVYKKCTT